MAAIYCLSPYRARGMPGRPELRLLHPLPCPPPPPPPPPPPTPPAPGVVCSLPEASEVSLLFGFQAVHVVYHSTDRWQCSHRATFDPCAILQIRPLCQKREEEQEGRHVPPMQQKNIDTPSASTLPRHTHMHTHARARARAHTTVNLFIHL